MRKLVVETATGLIKNAVVVPAEELVIAAKTALATAEAAQAALIPEDDAGSHAVEAALQAAVKAIRTLSWNPPDGCTLVDDVLGAGPGDSIVAGVLVKLPALPHQPTAEELAAIHAQAMSEAADALVDAFGSNAAPAEKEARKAAALAFVAKALGR